MATSKFRPTEIPDQVSPSVREYLDRTLTEMSVLLDGAADYIDDATIAHTDEAETITAAWTWLDQATPFKFDVDTDTDVDFQWILDGTLTALWRWDSSANIFRFQDRTPSAVSVFNIDLENRQLVLQFDNTDIVSQTMSAEAFVMDSTQHIRLSPASGHFVQVYDPGATAQLRMYDSTGADALYAYHNGTDGIIGTTGTSPGELQLTPGGGNVVINPPATKALEILGSSYQTSPTGMVLGRYSTTQGYIQVPGGTTGILEIWNSATAKIAEFRSTAKEFYAYGRANIRRGNGEALTLTAGSTGNAANTWLQFDDSADVRMGFVGYGSSGNEDMYIWNDVGDVWIQAGVGNPGIFYVYEDVLIADDATSTFTAPASAVHGVWMIKNSWDDSGDGMFSHTAQSVTSFGGGVNFQLGDNGINPDVDGDVNAYMSTSSVLSIKNRTGGTRRFIVYYWGG